MLQKATEGVRKQVQKVCEKYGRPRVTLQFRLGPKFNKPAHGKPTYLSEEEKSWANGTNYLLIRHPTLKLTTPEDVTLSSTNLAKNKIKKMHQRHQVSAQTLEKF